MSVQHLRSSEQAREDTSPEKIDVTSKSPVGDISVVTLIRTDTTLDHSQKAEKVCGEVPAERRVTFVTWSALVELHAWSQYYVHIAQSHGQAFYDVVGTRIDLLGRSPRKNCKNDLDDQT